MSFYSLYDKIVEYGGSLQLSHKDVTVLLQTLDSRMCDSIHTSLILSQAMGYPNNPYYKSKSSDNKCVSYISLTSGYQDPYLIMNAAMIGLVKFFLQLHQLMGKESHKGKAMRLQCDRRYSYGGLFTPMESVKIDHQKIISPRCYISKYEDQAFPYVYQTRGVVVHFLSHDEIPDQELSQEEESSEEEVVLKQLPSI